MDTYHCSHCYNLLFMCRPNSYPVNTNTIKIKKQMTINLQEVLNGFIKCVRCEFITGEVNDDQHYNIFLERVKSYHHEN